MTRLVHVIADYGAGGLAFAELVQRLGQVLPDLELQHTRVAPGDTLAAGYCVARLALTPGAAGRLVLHDVAGPDGELERLCVARTADGVLVAGRDAGWCWSFVVDALRGIWVLDVPARAWPRDPADAVPKAVVRVLAGHRHALRDRLPRAAVPPYPSRAVAYVDGHGNLKTTITGLPAPPGSRVLVRIGEMSAPAIVADANGALAHGELVLAPISPGWRTRSDAQPPHMELAVRGGSAAQHLGEPRPGAPISVLPIEPQRRPPVPASPRRQPAARHRTRRRAPERAASACAVRTALRPSALSGKPARTAARRGAPIPRAPARSRTAGRSAAARRSHPAAPARAGRRGLSRRAARPHRPRRAHSSPPRSSATAGSSTRSSPFWQAASVGRAVVAEDGRDGQVRARPSCDANGEAPGRGIKRERVGGGEDDAVARPPDTACRRRTSA